MHEYMSVKHIVAFLLGASLSAAIAAVLWSRSEPSPERLRAMLLGKPEFLADHPDVLEAAGAVLQTRMLAAQGVERAALIRQKWQALTHVAFTPAIGSPDAPLVLLEFTDYTCEPCRKSAPAVSEALNGNADVRVAVLLLPIGGALAEYAARVAWAAYRQNPNRFAELHHRLMNPTAQLSQDSVLATARALGYDIEQIEREGATAQSRHYFDQVRMFAEDLHISGVPAFALNEQLVLGGITAAQLEALIQEARATRATGQQLTQSSEETR